MKVKIFLSKLIFKMTHKQQKNTRTSN